MKSQKSCDFNPGVTDPIAYDFLALRYLIGICREPMQLTLSTLRRRAYEFQSTNILKQDALDEELLYRQCIPAACIGVNLGFPASDISSFLTLFATCQTLILNHIDRHLDLSSSHTIRNPMLLLADVHGVMCYAVAELYTGMRDATATRQGSAALHEMASVSGLIIQSMYDNYRSRYREDLLEFPNQVLESYADPIQSRHLGSGFYASSIRGMYAYFDEALTDSFADVLSKMRRLRQRTDELSDLLEDSATGLITYPVAKLLASDPYHKNATALLRSTWARTREVVAAQGGHAGRASEAILADTRIRGNHARLVEMLEESGVLMMCYTEASELWSAARGSAEDNLPLPVADIVKVILDLKRAFLERMVHAKWDDNIQHTFLDILSASTEEYQ